MIKGEAVIEFSVIGVDSKDKDKLVWLLDKIRSELREIGTIPRMNIAYSEFEEESEEKPGED